MPSRNRAWGKGLGCGRFAMSLMGLLTAAAPAAADDWNSGTGGNPARNSLTSAVGPDNPDLLWQGSLSAIVAQPAVIEGDVVVLARITSFDIPTGTFIVAHDLDTGAQLWTAQLPASFKDSWRSRVSAIRDGQVYATRSGNGTNEEFMYALDVTDGSIIWQSEILIAEGSTESASFAPNGDLIIGSFDHLTRMDKDDGTTVWDVPRSCPTTNGCEASVFGDKVYIWQASPFGPVVTAFDLATGAELYSSDAVSGGFVQQVGLMVGPEGTIYAPRGANNPVTDFFTALEDTGTAIVEKWDVPMGFIPFASHGVGPDGSVYMYQTDLENGKLTILRLDPADGSIIDTSPELDTSDVAPSPRIAIDAEGKIFLTNGGFPTGRFYSLNADLSIRWSEPIVNVNIGGPAIARDGAVVVAGVGTDVRAYRSATPDCFADCDGDGELNVLDFVCYQGLFAAGEPEADCNDDGMLNVLDFICFQGEFAAGCE